MKAKFFFNNWIPKILMIEAITLYPFIFCASSEEKSIKNFTIHHEMVHVEQVRRLGWFKMYWNYLFNYFKFRFAGLKHSEAYYTLPMEAEAFKRQKEPGLLEAYYVEKNTK